VSYLNEIASISPDALAYVDESGIDQYLHRQYGYSRRGEPIPGKISGRRYRRIAIVAATLGKRIISPMLYPGTTDSALFEIWFEQMLLPSLPPGSVIVMDNASFHRKKHLNVISSRYGFRLLFLPPYSPDLNPIKHFWSSIKRRLRYSLGDSISLQHAIMEIF